MYREKSNTCSCTFNIITSLLVATGIAAVFFSGLIGAIEVLIFITLILAILALIGLLIVIFGRNRFLCDCITNSFLVTSIIGAIITSVFALTITLATATVTVAILIGTVAFFLVSLIISLIDILICILCTRNNYHTDC